MAACICHWARAVDNSVELLLLQHPLEQGEAKGTARLLRLSLKRCQVWVGEQFDPAALAMATAGAALLYPAAVAAHDRQWSSGGGAPTRLVVIDATWPKSRKMMALNPVLQGLQRLSLAAQTLPQSRYAALRRARQPHQLSTLEASVFALQQWEPEPARYAPLLMAFEGFVAEQIDQRELSALRLAAD
ncbi:tRNA-uridine aminocarboxypropyltransferase [soil metagenome]